LMSFEDALNIFFLENCGYYKDLKIRILTWIIWKYSFRTAQ
jgi:hypothetical protein